jgi:hypothetical protein
MKKLYLFFRAEGFYPLELKDDEDARVNARLNPGTIRVENIKGDTIWKMPEQLQNPNDSIAQ